jgi:hypothetical protein
MTPALLLLLAVPGQADAEFEIRTLGGESIVGRLRSVAADGSLAVGDKTVPAGEWYAVRRAAGPLPTWPRAPHAELNGGDRLVGTIVAADGDDLRLKLAFPGLADQFVRLPLSAVRAVRLTTRPANDPDWLTAPRKRDLFLARNGDSAAGALTAVDAAANAVTFQADGREHRLDLSKLAAIGFNTDLARARRPKGPLYRLTLADGSRLSAQHVTFDGRTWAATTLFKDTVRIPADQLVSADVEQGRVVSLSDLRPTKYSYLTFDGEQFSWAADRCVTGRAIALKTTVGDSTFDRGVGLHAECTITYALSGKYSRFEALVGLDARSGLRGDVVVAIRVNGEERPLPAGGHLTAAGGPVAVRIDVAGAKELTIAVRRGVGGNVQDHVDLAEARLIP